MDENKSHNIFTIDELDTIDNKELFQGLNLNKAQFEIKDVIPERFSENSKPKDKNSLKNQIENENNKNDNNENNENENNDCYILNQNEIIFDDNNQEPSDQNISNNDNKEEENSYNKEINDNYNEEEDVENNQQKKVNSNNDSIEDIPLLSNCLNFKDFMQKKNKLPKSKSSNNINNDKNTKINNINNIHNNNIINNRNNKIIKNNTVKTKIKNLIKINNNSAKIKHSQKKSEHQKYIEQLSKPKKSSTKKIPNNYQEEISKNTPIIRKIRNEDLFHLYEDDKKIRTKKEKMRQEYLEEKMKDCSFSPHINKLNPKFFPNSSNNGNNDNLITKNIKKKSLEMSNNFFDFKHIPTINKILKSKRMKNNNLDVYSRLYKTKDNNYCIKCCDYINDDEKNCTFKPSVNNNMACVNHNESFKNFMKRQKMFEKYLTEKKINLKNKINDIQKKKCTFTPNISCANSTKYSVKLDAKKHDEAFLDKNNCIGQKEPGYKENYYNFYNDYNEKIKEKKLIRHKSESKFVQKKNDDNNIYNNQNNEINENYDNYNENYNYYNENYNNNYDYNTKYYNDYIKNNYNNNNDYSDNNYNNNDYIDNNYNNNIDNINNINNNTNDDHNINYKDCEIDNYSNNKVKYKKRNLSANIIKNNYTSCYSKFNGFGNDIKEGNPFGICTNIAENCRNIKSIINKQKNRQNYNLMNTNNDFNSNNRNRYLY